MLAGVLRGVGLALLFLGKICVYIMLGVLASIAILLLLPFMALT